MSKITLNELERLAQWDTPTICNALEITNPERRGYGYTIRQMSCLNPSLNPVVGYARTAKIRATAPPLAVDRLTYYEYVAKQPTPTMIIIEDIDPSGMGRFGRSKPIFIKGLDPLVA